MNITLSAKGPGGQVTQTRSVTSATLPAVIAALPRRVFIGLELPTIIMTGSGGMKHITPAYCPDDDRVYFNGGDHSGDSYRQETFSLSIIERLTNIADRNAGWRIDYPYDGYGGDSVQPKHPDYCAFTWDETRKCFWFGPGEMQSSDRHNSPGETSARANDKNFIMGEVMQFFPYAPGPEKWKQVGAGWGQRPAETWAMTRDPKLDRLLRISWDNTQAWVEVFDCKTARWADLIKTPAIGAWVAKDFHCVDLKRRRIYFVFAGYRDQTDTTVLRHSQLWSMNMDDYSDWKNYGQVPNEDLIVNRETPVYDPLNDLVFRYSRGYSKLNAWSPVTTQWEDIQYTTQPPDRLINKRLMVNWPNYGIFIAFGGVPGEDGANPYMEVFRY